MNTLENSLFGPALKEAVSVFESLQKLEPQLLIASRWCVETLNAGGQILTCGNGGSAAEAQHLAGELMGRYRFARPSLAAVALSSDSVLMSCLGNDYSFDDVFARQVEGLARTGDILIVFSTSGNSHNIVNALRTAARLRIRTIAFVGGDGGRAAALADCTLRINHAETARCQEAHQFLLHCLMDQIERVLFPKPDPSSKASGRRRSATRRGSRQMPPGKPG